MSKEEEERKHYNRKLIQEGMKDELKKPRKFSWTDLISTIIGCFLGLLLLDFINLEALIPNIFLSFMVSVLIVTAVILVVKIIAYAIEKLIRKN